MSEALIQALRDCVSHWENIEIFYLLEICYANGLTDSQITVFLRDR